VSSSARERSDRSSLRAYEALHEHAELELELAGSGALERMHALGAHWEELLAGVPDQPPPAAAALLERAQLIHERTCVELARVREALLADLATVKRARRAADGYAGQLQRRPRLDRRA
jgi:hypothetical protein